MMHVHPAVLSILAGLAAIVLFGVSRRRRRPAAAPESVEPPGDTAMLLEAARDLAHAAIESTEDVRRVLDDALRTIVPQIDGVVVVEVGEQIRCAYGSGNRFLRYPGAELPESGWLRDVKQIGSAAQPLHPSDAAAIVVPLGDTIAGGTHSIVYVSAPAASFTAERLREIETLSDISSPLYALARAREDDQTKANYDPLTGLTNKATFHLRLEQAASSGQKIVLAFIDGDNFKRWNDTYGHASGDACIDRLAQVIREFTLSREDIVGRMGGDEFAIAFVGATKSDAVAQCIRICGAIAADDRSDIVPREKVAADGGVLVKITGSIGVAALGDDAKGPRELLSAADRALYRAKGNAIDGYEPVVPGKNTVCYWMDGKIVEVGAVERARILSQTTAGGVR